MALKFSVLLPTRNRHDLLARAIETVRRQDYPHWEIIVSDNQSEEAVGDYIKQLDDERIHYFRSDAFIPVTDNWNRAIEQSSGDYIIMLGDDDGLLPGYFTTLLQHIQAFDHPDAIYTGALLYAYPDVMPGCPNGFLRSYENREIYQGREEPFRLDKQTAHALVEASMNFHVAFDYNMQFTLVSRKLVERLRFAGPFYQSPYPDYYASNVIMLEAKHIVVEPTPLVVVGISPKSFGYYYFNNAEDEGNRFLNNLPDPSIANELRKAILPGNAMNTSWLIAMQTVYTNFGKRHELKVNEQRYRKVQILSVCGDYLVGKEGSNKVWQQLCKKLRIVEWLYLALPFLFKRQRTPVREYGVLLQQLQRKADSHPAVDMPETHGRFETILDVFNQFVPQQWHQQRKP